MACIAITLVIVVGYLAYDYHRETVEFENQKSKIEFEQTNRRLEEKWRKSVNKEMLEMMKDWEVIINNELNKIPSTPRFNP